MSTSSHWQRSWLQAGAWCFGVLAVVAAPSVVAEWGVWNTPQTSAVDRMVTTPVEDAAVAARPAESAGQQTSITSEQVLEALRNSELTASMPLAGLQLEKAQRGMADDSWARVHVQSPEAGEATVVLHQQQGTWQVAEIGTYQVGCDILPQQLRTEWELGCEADFN